MSYEAPLRKTYSRSTTRDSIHRSLSQQSAASQLLSSLMSVASNENSDDSDSDDSDLHPPAPKPRPAVETLAELLFSADHLETILQDRQSFTDFSNFLHQYQPQLASLLTNYGLRTDAQHGPNHDSVGSTGTSVLSETTGTSDITRNFDIGNNSQNPAFQPLLREGLPAYVTHTLVKIVSECLEDEITARQNPMARALVGGLSEVFCLTDPNQEDNPIVFASEEFYRLTKFGPDEVIGHNCRFLQGPMTKNGSPAKLKVNIQDGKEVNETILNYRRDGRPFINLLMIAPLFDDRGNVRYHIGAQVDVSGLVEGGRAIDSFRKLLNRQGGKLQPAGDDLTQQLAREYPARASASVGIEDISESLEDNRSSTARSASQDTVSNQPSEGVEVESKSTSVIDDSTTEEGSVSQNEWSVQDVSAGKLPGVYDNYMLVRPSPSMRIMFTSSGLQSWSSTVQSHFLSHVVTDDVTLSGLRDCFESGTPVSAKIKFALQDNQESEATQSQNDKMIQQLGRSFWISATPLLGSDNRVGVWMIVFVERPKDRARIERQGVFRRLISEIEHESLTRRVMRRQSYQVVGKDVPIKPKRLESSENLPIASRNRAFGTIERGLSSNATPVNMSRNDVKEVKRSDSTTAISVHDALDGHVDMIPHSLPQRQSRRILNPPTDEDSPSSDEG